MSDVIMKRGDTKPVLLRQLSQTIGDVTSAIDLTTAVTVTFLMRAEDGTGDVLGGTCTVVNAPNGVVSYAWASVDTAVAGLYVSEFEIAWPDGVQTVPSGNQVTGADTGDFLTIELVEDIDGAAPVLLR